MKLGQTGKDVITGFTGVCMGKAQYLTGCNQVYLVPRKAKEGKRPDGEWFDEQRVKPTTDKIVVLDPGLGMDEREAPKR